MKSPRKRRAIQEVLPANAGGMNFNYCRNPGCLNFGVPFDPNVRRGSAAVGSYRIVGVQEDSQLVCKLCGRKTTVLSNAGIAQEIQRLRTANGLLRPESCPEPSCENKDFPVLVHQERYHRHGKTAAGAERWRCKRCRTTLTLLEDERGQTAAEVNQQIVRDLVNRASLNAVMRKTGLSPMLLYDRIDFIHRQMIAFEACKVRKLKRTRGKHRRYFALATDAQDQQVNWQSRYRRKGVKVSTITTADNITGFVFRSDTTFDPTVGDVVGYFETLLDSGAFDRARSDAPHLRLQHGLFLAAVDYVVRQRMRKPPTAREKRLLDALAGLGVQPDEHPAVEAPGNPVSGCLTSPIYTAIAHLRLIAEMLPADATVHLMTDADGTFIAAEPIAFMELLKNNQADLTYVYFDKAQTTASKHQIMRAFRAHLQAFMDQCDPWWSLKEKRNAFISAYAKRSVQVASTPGEWWHSPIETMYEPLRRVGIAHQRRMSDEAKRIDRWCELLANSSLHAVDSYFNVLRQRVSYLHRPGFSRSSQNWYNAFQAYRPAMIQKIVDIARVYFNWVEPRPFRISRRFSPLKPIFDSGHEVIAFEAEEQIRKKWREKKSTPAMRIRLARAPVRLDTILYGKWPKKLLTPAKKAADIPKSSGRRRLPPGTPELDHSIPF